MGQTSCYDPDQTDSEILIPNVLAARRAIVGGRSQCIWLVPMETLRDLLDRPRVLYFSVLFREASPSSPETFKLSLLSAKVWTERVRTRVYASDASVRHSPRGDASS